jgi:hypothetical protein
MGEKVKGQERMVKGLKKEEEKRTEWKQRNKEIFSPQLHIFQPLNVIHDVKHTNYMEQSPS